MTANGSQSPCRGFEPSQIDDCQTPPRVTNDFHVRKGSHLAGNSFAVRSNSVGNLRMCRRVSHFDAVAPSLALLGQAKQLAMDPRLNVKRAELENLFRYAAYA